MWHKQIFLLLWERLLSATYGRRPHLLPQTGGIKGDVHVCQSVLRRWWGLSGPSWLSSLALPASVWRRRTLRGSARPELSSARDWAWRWRGAGRAVRGARPVSGGQSQRTSTIGLSWGWRGRALITAPPLMRLKVCSTEVWKVSGSLVIIAPQFSAHGGVAVEICVFQSLGWVNEDSPPVFHYEEYYEDVSSLPPSVRQTTGEHWESRIWCRSALSSTGLAASEIVGWTPPWISRSIWLGVTTLTQRAASFTTWSTAGQISAASPESSARPALSSSRMSSTPGHLPVSRRAPPVMAEYFRG